MKLKKTLIILPAVLAAAAAAVLIAFAAGGRDGGAFGSGPGAQAESGIPNNRPEAASTEPAGAVSGTAAENPGGSRVLVAYFSRVGNTDFPADMDAVSSASLNVRGGGFAGNNQLVAEAVHNLAGGDLVEIVTKDPYPADYDETVEQSHG